MVSIVFTGRTGPVRIENSDRVLTEQDKFPLRGCYCKEDFAKYSSLRAKLESGVMRFGFTNKGLHTITTYSLKEELTTEEIDILRDETVEQWAYGIGKAYSEFPCGKHIDYNKVFITPWYHGQTVNTDIKF